MELPPKIDKKSREWRYISEWAESKLAKFREMLEDQNTDQDLTNAYRGSIATLKELLTLVDEKPSVGHGQEADDYDVGVHIG